jgi:hypothetical protein
LSDVDKTSLLGAASAAIHQLEQCDNVYQDESNSGTRWAPLLARSVLGWRAEYCSGVPNVIDLRVPSTDNDTGGAVGHLFDAGSHGSIVEVTPTVRFVSTYCISDAITVYFDEVNNVFVAIQVGGETCPPELLVQLKSATMKYGNVMGEGDFATELAEAAEMAGMLHAPSMEFAAAFLAECSKWRPCSAIEAPESPICVSQAKDRALWSAGHSDEAIPSVPAGLAGCSYKSSGSVAYWLAYKHGFA